MPRRNLLEELHALPAHEVRTFMDQIRETIQEAPVPERMRAAGVTATATARPSAVEIEQECGLVKIRQTVIGSDITWHIAPLSPKRPWKKNDDFVVVTVMRVMAATIPSRIRVDVSFPYHDPDGQWQIREMSFCARGIKDVWNVRQQDLEKMTETLFKALNALV